MNATEMADRMDAPLRFVRFIDWMTSHQPPELAPLARLNFDPTPLPGSSSHDRPLEIHPRLQCCLLPTSSLSPKQTVQTLSNPLYSRTIEVGSESGGDIGRGRGVAEWGNEISKTVP
jgi:hypothetical protein